jgi:D-glycero-D-manno-heptose 1,7-bisphosphate phosphatase
VLEKIMKKTIFLDRDGVINQDSSDYIKSWSEFQFIPGSIDAIRDLTINGFGIVLITNQSVINRKMASKEDVENIFEKMKTEIKSNGGSILDIFYCPHKPDDGCECRKPLPGMILKAKIKHRIDLSTAYMVGDNLKDMECAKNAGCGYSVLVRTGNGKQAQKVLEENKITPIHIADNLYEASRWIINHSNNKIPQARIPG